MNRARHGARAALLLGVLVSIVGNVLHAADNIISQIMSGWAPVALWIAIELIAKVPAEWGWKKAVRLAAATLIAGIAGWVSYWHMVGVAVRYGEQPGAAHLIPLTVDGLVVVAWICLVELGGQTRGASNGIAREGSEAGREDRAAPGSREQHSGSDGEGHPGDPTREQEVAGGRADGAARLPTETGSDRADQSTDRPDGGRSGTDRPVHAEPGLREGAARSAKLSRPRKAHTTNPQRIERAHRKTPAASHQEIADRLKLSPATVKRYRPAAAVNGVQTGPPHWRAMGTDSSGERNE